MKRVSILLTSLALSGCTAAQMQSMNMQKSLGEGQENLKTCVTEVYQNPKYAAITPYMPPPDNNAQPTMEQLANEKLPTKQEAQLLMSFRDEVKSCRVPFNTRIKMTAPALAPVLLEHENAMDKIVLKLAKRKISWGQALQESQALQASTASKLSAVGSQMEASLQAQHQMEMQNRQAASNALMQWSAQEQQRVNTLNQMSMDQANRMQMPTQTRCTTRYNAFSKQYDTSCLGY